MTDENPKPAKPDATRPDDAKPSPAGPHDKPDLTDADKTPGAGSLPDPKGGEADAGVG